VDYDPGRIPIGQPLPCRQIASGGGDPWSIEQAKIDCIAHRQADLAGIAERANRGLAGGNALLRKEQRAESAEFHGLVKIDILLAFGVAISEMRVHIE
jgi:hypothetical protein